ncbi:MAG: hypothetical protein Q9174_000253 [Haloplaca sp. 1 TL-2023]
MPPFPTRHLAAPLINRSSLTLARIPNSAAVTLRPFTTTPHQKFTNTPIHHSGDSHYDPPSGWLWGIPPGEKREKEGWENDTNVGFGGSEEEIGSRGHLARSVTQKLDVKPT